MRRLPPQVEDGILRRLLQGVDYRHIGHEFDVSIATVSRVFDDARKTTPDIDTLRELSVLLRKAGTSVFEATRACRLMEIMNRFGISADELDGYVRTNERFLSERALDEDFIFYTTELTRLEQVYGLTYQDVVKDFERKRRETSEAEERKTALENESFGLIADLKDAKKNLAEIELEIVKATAAKKGLAEIGIGKLAQLALFIQDFESMGFDAHRAKKLAVWHEKLEKLHIDPDKLGQFIAERGPLEAQNNTLRDGNDRLKAEANAQALRRATLVAGSPVLQAVDQILRTGTLTMFCKSCRYPMPLVLPTQESLSNLIGTGQVLSLGCPNCGLAQWFSPWDIALQVAWAILPADAMTI